MTSSSGCDDSVRQCELSDRLAQVLAGHCEKRFSRSGGRLSQIVKVEIRGCRLTAGRGALVGNDGRIALHELNALDGHTEFFRHELSLRSEQALSKIALPGECRDGAIGAY